MIEIKDNIIRIPLALIDKNAWNPNEQSDFIFEKELNSIRQFGFLDPIDVRERPDGRFEIIDGEHRWLAAKHLGLEEIPANNLGQVSDAHALQLTVIRNETRGQAQREPLAALFKKLQGEHAVTLDDIYRNMPYQPTEIDAYMAEMEVDWDSIGKRGAPPDNAGGPAGGSADTGGSESQGNSSSGSQGSPSSGGGSSSSGSGLDQEDWVTVSFRLPVGVAEQLQAQITRFKKALHPDDDPKDCSPVQALEAMTQHLAQLEDGSLI